MDHLDAIFQQHYDYVVNGRGPGLNLDKIAERNCKLSLTTPVGQTAPEPPDGKLSGD